MTPRRAPSWTPVTVPEYPVKRQSTRCQADSGVAAYQWHGDPLSCPCNEPRGTRGLSRPFRAFSVGRHGFPGQCPGLEYYAPSGLRRSVRVALEKKGDFSNTGLFQSLAPIWAGPFKGRPNKPQGNALRKCPGFLLAYLQRAPALTTGFSRWYRAHHVIVQRRGAGLPVCRALAGIPVRRGLQPRFSGVKGFIRILPPNYSRTHGPQ